MKSSALSSRSFVDYLTFPKVDLHRHLEGSLRLATLLEIGRAHGLSVADTSRLRELVQVRQDELFSFENFLAKFQTLRLFYRTPDVISRIAAEAVEDAAADGVVYVELRFTPAALARAEGFSMADVMDWVIAGVRSGAAKTGIRAGLIVSLNRHESVELAEKVVDSAAARVGHGILGIDLAGDEVNFPALPFAPLIAEAGQAGLHVTVHAGEWGGAEHVSEAILRLGAERIGHGVRVLEDPAVTSLARERGTTFEVCITSNYHTGAVHPGVVHPFSRMLQRGLKATLNTDDPSISQIRLSGEYARAADELGISAETLYQCTITAAKASFLPNDEKNLMLAELEKAQP